MASDRVVISGSERTAPPGVCTGPEPQDDRGQVSLYLKADRASHPAADPFVTRSELAARRRDTLAEAMARMRTFAEDAGLEVVEADPARRLLRL